jgi:hypothetical protein
MITHARNIGWFSIRKNKIVLSTKRISSIVRDQMHFVFSLILLLLFDIPIHAHPIDCMYSQSLIYTCLERADLFNDIFHQENKLTLSILFFVCHLLLYY